MHALQEIVRRMAHIDAEHVGARVEQGRHHLWRARGRAQSGDDLGLALTSHGGLVGKTLRPVRRIAGIDLEKSAAVEAALGAFLPSGDEEFRARRDAEMRLSFPSARRAAGGVEIIITRLQRSVEQPAAAFGRHNPPALAGPVRAVETAQRHTRAGFALVADIESGISRRGRQDRCRRREEKCKHCATHRWEHLVSRGQRQGAACPWRNPILQARQMDAPFTSIPFAPEKQSPLLFLCDHASNAVPPPYGDLGLSKTLFQTHIAYDIGAADVATSLAKAYGAAALLGGVSRLLIDLNH